MLKIGLTGGIGSGKSTISKYISELGFKVVDADVVSREVLELYPEITEEVRKQFGDEFFMENNQLDRKKFGKCLFQNREKLKQYEKIIIPYIKKEIYKRIETIEKEGEAVCFLDAPTLIENGMHKEMDKNILVWADRNIQVKRIIERDKMSLLDVNNRINAQMSLEDKKKVVDFVVNNSGKIEDTKKDIYKIIYDLGLLKGRCICPNK
ncbi:MAG: dephospho-CoA kinase [Solirubrobacterales bacterium]